MLSINSDKDYVWASFLIGRGEDQYKMYTHRYNVMECFNRMSM